MPVVFIARANFTRSGTLLLVAQASGLLFPASRRKLFATTIIFPTTANPQAASPREIWRDAKFNRRDACSTQKHPAGCCVRPVQRAGNKPSPVLGRKEFVSTSVLTLALSSRRGRIVRRLSENSRDWICRTVIRKTGNIRLLFLLPGGEGQVEGGCKTSFPFCLSRTRTIPPRGIELQL
jgi:hypothetical protein